MSRFWGTPRAPLWAIALVIAAQYALDALFNLVVFREHWPGFVARATGGLVNGTLIAYAIMIPMVVGFMILVAGRLRPAEVGLLKRDVRPAIVWTALLWAAVAGAEAAFQIGHFALDPSWSKPGTAIGALAAQIFGNALYEEIVYRGFLTVQLMLLFERFGRMGATIAAVIVAQIVFASIHVPMLLHQGLLLPDIAGLMPELFLAGVGLAALYFLTGNLFVAVGVHALVDAPTLIAPDVSGLGDDFGYVFLALALVAACVWRWLRPTGSAR